MHTIIEFIPTSDGFKIVQLMPPFDGCITANAYALPKSEKEHIYLVELMDGRVFAEYGKEYYIKHIESITKGFKV